MTKNIETIVKIIDNFNATYSDWIENCVTVFPQLSIKSKQSAGIFAFRCANFKV